MVTFFFIETSFLIIAVFSLLSFDSRYHGKFKCRISTTAFCFCGYLSLEFKIHHISSVVGFPGLKSFLFFKIGHRPIFIFLADNCPLWGYWYPCFGFLVTSSLCGLPYSHCRGERNVRSLRSTSGATHCRPLDGKHEISPSGLDTLV